MDNKAMYKLSYGLFVLTTEYEGKVNGCITNTAIQVARIPFCVCGNKSFLLLGRRLWLLFCYYGGCEYDFTFGRLWT